MGKSVNVFIDFSQASWISKVIKIRIIGALVQLIEYFSISSTSPPCSQGFPPWFQDCIIEDIGTGYFLKNLTQAHDVKCATLGRQAPTFCLFHSALPHSATKVGLNPKMSQV